MCFTVNVNLVKEEIENRYNVSFPGKYRYEPSYYYHAFGLPDLPAICSSSPSKVRMLKWGLIPGWTRSDEDAEEIRLKTFNARAESILEKPSYSSSVKNKRCIIPVRGFYEWQHSGKLKIPWYIYRTDGDIMSLAGLYSEWLQSSTGELICTFTIITTGANRLMAEIHNSKKRMPAILEKESEKTWLNADYDEAEILKILKIGADELLTAHTVSSLINNRTADKNNPDIIKPYSYTTGNLLF
jgi:putative SOS response-associated peptidase YedK